MSDTFGRMPCSTALLMSHERSYSEYGSDRVSSSHITMPKLTMRRREHKRAPENIGRGSIEIAPEHLICY